ncbi:MAG: alanine racemase [Pirellulales bacterium]
MRDPLATPLMQIDAEVVRRNLRRLVDYAAEYGLLIRPHTKTHKSKHVAEMQLHEDSIGLTVAKVGEAEVMSQVGDDLLLAFPALDKARTKRLAQLALHKTVRVAIDSMEAADALGAAARATRGTIGILIEQDVGFHRTGVQTASAALRLAAHVDSAAGLRLDGLMCYPGHVWMPADQQEPALQQISDLLHATLVLWSDHGLEAGIVSGGSTPTAYQSHHIPELTEIRPGTYVYNDMNTVRGGYCTLDDCAVRLIATVVSNAVPGQVVIDAGSKTLTSDRCVPAPDAGFGYITEYPQAVITKLSEEHGQVDVTACPQPPKLGERVSIIPNHICPCVNLQTAVWWQEAEGRSAEMVVDARGMLS